MRTITVWLIVFLAAASAFAQESLRPDVPVALVGGMLLDGYEAEPIHHSVVVFENGCITAVGSKLDTEKGAGHICLADRHSPNDPVAPGNTTGDS